MCVCWVLFFCGFYFLFFFFVVCFGFSSFFVCVVKGQISETVKQFQKRKKCEICVFLQMYIYIYIYIYIYVCVCVCVCVLYDE